MKKNHLYMEDKLAGQLAKRPMALTRVKRYIEQGARNRAPRSQPRNAREDS